MSGMFTMQPDGYHPVLGMFTDYYQQRMQSQFSGGGKSGEAKQNAARSSFKGGVGIGLAAYGNELRAKRYASLAHKSLGIPMLMGSDFEKWLTEFSDVFDEQVRGQKASAERIESENKFYAAVLDSFMGKAYPEKMELQLVEQRQEAIMAGAVPETSEEREWLQERLQERRLELDRLEKIAHKADNPKVNTA